MGQSLNSEILKIGLDLSLGLRFNDGELRPITEVQAADKRLTVKKLCFFHDMANFRAVY